jgi:signal transduction histidine kinase
MDLGMAKAKLDRDPASARELIQRAHASAKEAITEMRQVARGIHPPVLTDRGLDAALSALAARSPVPVTVRVEVAPRPQPTVEAIAYFCVSEALTNIAKHSRATSAQVEVVRQDGALLVTVSDDGVGGVDPSRGTGLVGLRDRAAAVDGTITVSSPVGGPTVLSVRLPERRNPYRAPAPPSGPGTTATAPILTHPPVAHDLRSATGPPPIWRSGPPPPMPPPAMPRPTGLPRDPWSSP